MQIGGPFWGGPLHDQAIVDSILERVESGTLVPQPSTAIRIKGIFEYIYIHIYI
jgi:tRNA G26 N,N-dimethylase Trm1